MIVKDGKLDWMVVILDTFRQLKIQSKFVNLLISKLMQCIENTTPPLFLPSMQSVLYAFIYK